MKKIAVFNHKGGVSKTTTTFNLGWKLARMGYRVLLVDADSQCNLTQYSIGIAAFEAYYESENKNNIKDALEPAFKSKPMLISAVDCLQVNRNENLYLLPGHLDLSENEVQLGLSFQLTESVEALKNLPGSFNYLFSCLADKYKIDFVLIDMNPSLSAINQDLFISSDYFIVPTSPDIFSFMSIRSLSKFLPAWEKWAKKARPLFSDADYKLTETTPKFIGYTINDFNLSDGRPTNAFGKLMDKIRKEVESALVPKLDVMGMLLPEEAYERAYELNSRLQKQRQLSRYCLAEISNFNKLIAESNKASIPVYELNGDRWEDGQKKTLHWFRMLFDILAEKIVIMTKYA